jgi:hypothetical protein
MYEMVGIDQLDNGSSRMGESENESKSVTSSESAYILPFLGLALAIVVLRLANPLKATSKYGSLSSGSRDSGQRRCQLMRLQGHSHGQGGHST